MVKTKRNHSDWYKNIKRLINNPELITEMGEKLYGTVKDTYSTDAVAEKRRNLYLNLMEKKLKKENENVVV